MPPDERPAKVAERCAEHPGRRSVATCDVCGRPVCVACAIPVRGRVVGVGCIGSVLGASDVPTAGPRWDRSELAGAVGLVVVVVASLLPWTRFGIGSSFFGGWDPLPGWSLLASIAGLVALVAWIRTGGRRRGADLVTVAGGFVAAAAAIMALVHPPPFTRPWIGPWLAIAGGLAAIVGGSVDARRERRVG